MNLLWRTAEELRRREGDERHASAVLSVARRLIMHQPQSAVSWIRLGDALKRVGNEDEAIDAYRRALEVNDDAALDPLRQLNDGE